MPAALQLRFCDPGKLPGWKRALKGKSYDLELLLSFITSISQFIYMHSVIRIKAWLTLMGSQVPISLIVFMWWSFALKKSAFWVEACSKDLAFGEASGRNYDQGHRMWQLPVLRLLWVPFRASRGDVSGLRPLFDFELSSPTSMRVPCSEEKVLVSLLGLVSVPYFQP